MNDVVWNDTYKTQSPSFIVLNAIFDRLSTSSLFSAYAIRRISSQLPVEGKIQIPFLGVFRNNDKFDGVSPRQTAIGFDYTFDIGIQIIVANNDGVEMLAELDRASWFIVNQILRDDTFTNRKYTNLKEETAINGLKRVDVPPDRWGLSGANNETPVGIRIVKASFDLGELILYPTEFPDLQRITVTTSYPPGSTPAEQQQVQQVKMVYMFDPDYVPPRLPNAP
jgi:hypothetical protein